MPAPVTALTRRGIPLDPHLRVLGAIALVDTLGRGATMTTVAIYFTHIVGMPATAVAFAIGLGALTEFALSTPLGILADRVEPRALLVGALIAMAVFAAGLLVVTGLPGLIVVNVGLGIAGTTSRALRNMMIARVGGPTGQAVEFKAYLRAVTNSGLAFGGLMGGLALWADTPAAYLAVFAWDAATFLLAAGVARQLPPLPDLPARPALPTRPARTDDATGEPTDAAATTRHTPVWRDLPYVVTTALVAIFAMHFVVMEVALPLWIAGHTAAPRWIVAVVFGVNTVAVALLQVRFSRSSATVPAGAASLARAGALLALGFAAIAAAGAVGPVWAVVLLLGGAVVQVFGELIGSGAQWALNMGLAPMERQGEYQGFASAGWSLSSSVSPALATWLCIDHGYAGWAAMTAIIVGAGLLAGVSGRWALHRRAAYGVTTHTG